MKHLIHTKAAIDALAAQIDAATGCPVEGVDGPGPGRRTPHDRATGAGWSLHYASRRGFADGRHALLVDAVVQALLDGGQVAAPSGSTTRALTAADEPPRPRRTPT